MQKLIIIVSIAMAIFTMQSVDAQVNFDNGGGDNLWTNPINWDTDTLPNGSSDTRINNNFDVILNSGTASGDFVSLGTTGSDMGSLTIQDSTLTANTVVIVGEAGSGVLTMASNAVANTFFLSVGDNSFGFGVLTMNNNSQITTTSNGFVGFSDNAIGGIQINNTAILQVGLNLFVGNDDDTQGTVTINDQGMLNVTNALVLGDLSSAQGTLILNDNATVVTGDDLALGVDDNTRGTVTTNDNSSITVGDDLAIGEFDSSVGTLTMNNNSRITVAGDLDLARANTSSGTVTMNDDSVLIIGDDFNIGLTDNSVGTVVLNGNAQVTVLDDLEFSRGGDSTGTMTINDNVNVTVTNNIIFGLAGGENGTLNMNGGQLSGRMLNIAENNVINLAGGSISISDTSTLFNPANINWTGGTLQTTHFTFNTTSDTLNVPNSASLIINNGGIFTGHLSLASGGSFNIVSGQSGSMTFDQGSLTLNSGSTTNLDIDNSGNDSITVQNTSSDVNLAGTAQITFSANGILVGDTFTVINNNGTGTISGTFDSILDNLPRIAFIGSIDGSTYILTATTAKTFQEIARSSEKGLGRMLDNLGSGTDLDSLISILNISSETEIQNRLQDLSGRSLVSSLSTNLYTARMSNQGLIHYLDYDSGFGSQPFAGDTFTRAERSNLAGQLAADTQDHSLTYTAYLAQQEQDSGDFWSSAPSTQPQSSQLRGAGDINVWASPVGGFFSRDTDSDTDGFEAYIVGIQGGIDYAFNENLLLGFSLSYTYGETTLFNSSGDAHTHSIRFGPYLTYENSGFYVNAGLTGGIHFIEGERQLNSFNTQADRDYSAFDLSTFARVGFNYRWENLILGPVLGLEYTYLYEDEFSESGAGIYNLTVKERDLHSFRTQLGFRAGALFELGDFEIIPELQVGWIYELLNDSQDIDAVFTSSPGSNFSFQSSDPTRHSVLVQTGVTIKITEDLSAILKYTGEFNSTERQNVGSVGVRLKF